MTPLESNTYYAQGGIIYQGNEDSPEPNLAEDLIRAGDGLNNRAGRRDPVHRRAAPGARAADRALPGALYPDARAANWSARARRRTPPAASCTSTTPPDAPSRRSWCEALRGAPEYRAADRAHGHRPADARAPLARPPGHLRAPVVRGRLCPRSRHRTRCITHSGQGHASWPPAGWGRSFCTPPTPRAPPATAWRWPIAPARASSMPSMCSSTPPLFYHRGQCPRF